MAYNEQDGLVDIFGGVADLKKQTIRCVGDAKARFSEDALRILRAVRFSAQLGFSIEEETKTAICQLAPNLQKISAERIQVELVKLLTSPHPEKIRDAWELGITAVILPEFDALMRTEQETPHHDRTVGEHTIRALQQVDADKVLRLTMLLHDMGKPQKKTMDGDGVAHFKGHAAVSEQIAKDVMHRLKFDNDTLRKVTKLVFYHDDRLEAKPRCVRRAMHRIGTELFPYYNAVRRADTLAQSMYQREEKLANLDAVEALYEEILQKQECVSLKDLAVTGRDLIEAGVAPGPDVGKALDRLLHLVIEDPELNQKERLLSLL